MKRITFTYTFILCLVSVFIVPKICVGYDTMWDTYDNEQDGRYKDIKDHETELIEAKAAVTDLNNAWSKIQTAKMEGEEAAIDAVANFAIGLVTTALNKGRWGNCLCTFGFQWLYGCKSKCKCHSYEH